MDLQKGMWVYTVVRTIMKNNPEMINDALLAYLAAPLTNNEYSPAELMFKINVKAYMFISNGYPFI